MAEISDEDYLAQHPEHKDLDPNIRAQLRQNAQLAADLEAERTARTNLERRAIFAEANLPDVPERDLFLQSYSGDLTVDAIREAAGKYPTLAGTAPATPPPAANSADLDALRRVGATSGGQPASAMDFGDALDRVTSKEDWERVMRQAPAETNLQLTRTVRGSRII